MKQLTFPSLLLLLLCTFSTKALAYDIAETNANGITTYYNYINDGTELEITFGPESTAFYSGAFVIPETASHLNIKVTRIGYHAFDSCRDLTSVSIPNSVTIIDEWAFYQCI